MTPGLKNLLKKIEEKLEWGESAAWQNRDFEALNERILDETRVSLSASTLRRLWGRVEYHHMPSITTLDTLAKFAGYDSWRHFQRSLPADANDDEKQPAISPREAPGKKHRAKRWRAVIGIIAIGLLSWAGIKNLVVHGEPSTYSFSSGPVVRDIPTSVIFRYDASSAKTDSVFIQQSWDEQTRVVVDKNKHTFTSIYYQPGFYEAKLVVGREVVKEHPLLIPTNGWLGMINNKPVPVYLNAPEFLRKDKLQLSTSDITRKNIAMQPQPPTVKYYNVGNFEPVSLADFTFSTDIKHEYREGAAACQRAFILLITDKSPLTIPLSVKGCVSELFLRGPNGMVSGKNEDLSAFGVDFSDWIHVTCKGRDGEIRYFINGKQVYTLPLSQKPPNIVGIGYVFVGTGAVKGVRLLEGKKSVFEAF